MIMRRHHNILVVAALVAALAALAAACGGNDADDTAAEARTGTSVRITVDDATSTSVEAPAAAATDGSEATTDDDGSEDSEDGSTTTIAVTDEPDTLPSDTLRLVEVATAEFPTTLISRPGSQDLWVAEREGLVRQLRRGGSGFELLDEPTLDIASSVGVEGEGGLLGLTFSADGQLLYVSYTNNNGDSVIAEYAMDGDRADPDSARILL